MVTKVVTNIHLFNFTIFILHLDEDIFEKVVEMLLNGSVTHDRHAWDRCCLAINSLCDVRWILIQILKQDCLAKGWLVMDS